MYKPLILRSRGATIGLTLIVLIFLIAAFAPFICWFDPWDYSSTPLQRPSSVHPLGTNAIGQDILSELLYGARTSLTFGLSVSAISLLLSVLIGVYAGISGGIIESILMRITDVAIAIPSIVMIIAAYLQPNLFQLILILSLLSWQYGARTFYAQTLSLKQRGYISAARKEVSGEIRFGGVNLLDLLLKDPRHPYTQDLLRAYPFMDTTKDLQGIRGKMPTFYDLPTGCRFSTRCTQKIAICEEKPPELTGCRTHEA